MGLQPHEFLQHIEIPIMGCLELMGGVNPSLNPHLPKICRALRRVGVGAGIWGICGGALDFHEFPWTFFGPPRIPLVGQGTP